MIDAALFSTLYLTVARTRRPIGPDDKFRTSYICAMPPE